MKTLLFIIACLFAMPAFTQSKKIKDKDVQKLARIMSGEFSSEAQSKRDTNFFHIRLRMKPIWTGRTDGYWLYVEQATASAEQRPYRQRVYHVFRNDDTTITSKVYELKTPSLYIGAWKDPSRFAAVTIDSLVDRQGCAIYLRKQKNTYTGSTPGQDCISTLRGAAYATSEVTIYPNKMITWDRGWNKAGKQVWGSEVGGYVFDKISE